MREEIRHRFWRKGVIGWGIQTMSLWMYGGLLEAGKSLADRMYKAVSKNVVMYGKRILAGKY